MSLTLGQSFEKGESGLSQSGLAKLCGKTRQAIIKLEKSLVTKSPSKWLEAFVGKNLTLVTKASGSDRKVRNTTIYHANYSAAVIKHYAYQGSQQAQDVDFQIGVIGLTSYIQGKTGWLPGEYQSSKQARAEVNRIMDTPWSWSLLYAKDTCSKGFLWYGSHFYWRYFYYWMNQEERAKHERVNPCKNGRRKYKIHQLIEPATRERLREKAIELGVLIKQSNCREAFERNFFATYGEGWQMDLDLNY